MIGTQPFTYENSSNPWLMDAKCDNNIIIDGQELTAKYLWSLNTEERKEMLEKVFKYYRERGFPFIFLSEEELKDEFNKLASKSPYSVVKSDPTTYISNSGNICIDITKHFCRDKFYEATGDKNISPLDVFKDDTLFRKVLMNRMGWNTSFEDGSERPYLFSINDKNIRAGIRNSGLAREVSNFRPLIAKYMFEYAAKKLNRETINIFDYSGGWGARALGAGSLGYSYSCVDPNTSSSIENICSFYNIKTSGILNLGSENEVVIESFGERVFDLCSSCPPYFTMERYSNDSTQSYNRFNSYFEWLEGYWRSTVRNCNKMMKDHAVFQLVIKDVYNKYPLKEDMMKIVHDEVENIVSVEEIPLRTAKGHLSGKRKTGSTVKENEWIITVERKCV